MKTKTVKIISAILGILIILIASGIFVFYKMTTPVNDSSQADDIRIEIPFGTSVKSVSVILKDNNLIKNSDIFYICARKPQLLKVFYSKSDYNFNNFTLKSGIYHLNNNMNIPQFLDVLSSGQQEYVKISIPEGYTITKIGEILEKNGVCKLNDFKASSRNSKILEEYKIPTDSCEGFLFPDTYFFNIGMDSDRVVRIMLDNFFEKFETLIDLNTISSDQLKNYVVLASIIEREYRIEEEAPVIASVFYNRLKYNIGLYSCATVEYIISEILGRPHPDRILIEDTKIDNPYNTYKWAGLPPGAISNPGLVALNASVNPAKTNYFYFQVADESAGRHVFTKDFETHISNHNLTLKK